LVIFGLIDLSKKTKNRERGGIMYLCIDRYRDRVGEIRTGAFTKVGLGCDS
jgi:hypothetical protein